MSKIKCLLVDDEIPALQILEKFAGMVEELEVVALCDNALKAFAVLDKEEIDLVFLDINMPVLTGVDFLKALKRPPSVIFTTAYREYAVESYELNVLDYLLKPFGFDRFLRAVDKYRYMKQSFSPPKAIDAGHLFFNVNRTNHKVLLQDVLYLESLKDYTRIHTVDGKLTIRGNLSTSLKKFPATGFIRIHRSFAVSLSKMDSYNQSEVVVAGQSLPLGATYRDEFLGKV